MTSARPAAPPWLPPDYPPDRRIRMRPAGVTWDAVRAPYYLGAAAVDQLGEACGAVIYDPREPALYWFVEHGSTAGWVVPHTRALGETHYLAIPALAATLPGLHWLIPPDERLLTDVALLREALLNAINEQLGPRPGVTS